MKTVLGVQVDDIDKSQALARARDFLASNGAHTVYTPNPEMVVLAQKDERFKQILNQGNLRLCDGKGLQLFGNIQNRVQGTDFVLDLCELAAEEDKTIYLLGTGSDAVLQKVRENLFLVFPQIRIVGWNSGPVLN